MSATIASLCSSDPSPAMAASERADQTGEVLDHTSNLAGTPSTGPASPSCSGSPGA